MSNKASKSELHPPHLSSSGGNQSLSLPLFSLAAFSLAGFITIMTELLPAGLLPQIGQSYGISDSMSGQMVSVYALGSTLFAVPLVAFTRAWSRKAVIILALSGLLVFNTLTAFSHHFYVSLGYRFVAGMAAGLVWGIFAGYARGLVAIKDQGKALAIAAIGQPVALALGLPLATFLASHFDWRWIFGFISILSAVLIFAIVFGVKNVAGYRATEKKSVFHVLTLPGISAVLTVMFLWILAHNMLYIYMSSYLKMVGSPQSLDTILLVFGVFAVVSIFFIGSQVDRRLRIMTLLSLAGFATAMVILTFVFNHLALVYISVALWGLTFGGAPTLLQTALADAAGDEADMAQSFFVTLFNLGVAGGGRIGGYLLDWTSAKALPLVSLILILIAVTIAVLAKKHAFKSGQRH